MQRIKSIGVLSSAKISGVIHGCVGLLVIPVMLIGGLTSLAAGENNGLAGGVGFLALAVFAPIFYAGAGFVIGGVMAWVYNLAAKWLGGIEIQLETVGATSSNTIGLI